MAKFGLNDEVIAQFGLDDEQVGQASVTKPAIPGGQAALLSQGHGPIGQRTSYTPQNPQYTDFPSMSEDMGPSMQMPTRPVQNYSDQQMSAAKQGVDIDANAGVGTARANFSITKEGRDERVTNAIKQAKGPNTPVRSGADSLSGDVEWYDKDAKRWKTAGNSFGGHVVNAIPAAGEVIGGVAGAFAPAPGISSALGAGGGRALGVGLKNLVGLSLDDNVKEDPMKAPSPFEEGLISTATNLVGNTVTSGIPAGFRKMVSGVDVAKPVEIRSIMDSYAKNSKYVDQINSSMQGVTDKRLTPNIARVAALPDKANQVNADAVNLAKNEPLLLNSTPEISAREVTRRVNNENVIELYWTNEIDNPTAVPNLTQENWQSRVKQEYDAYQSGQLGPYQAKAEQAVQQAEQAAKQMPQMGALNKSKIGQVVRKQINDAVEASKDVETQAWADYETAAGYKPNEVASSLRVPPSPKLTSSIAALKGLKKQALLDMQKGQADRYTPNLGNDLEDADKELFESLGVDHEKNGIDLAVLDRTIKDLRAEKSRAASGSIEPGISDANRNRILAGLVDSRAKFLKKQAPEVEAALAAAEAETKRHHAEFERSFLGNFLVKDDAYGAMRIADPKVLDYIMRNQDKQGAKQLADLVNGSPGAKKAVVDYVNAYYQKGFTKLLKDGSRVLDPRKHQIFVEQVLPNIKPFLNAQEVGEFRTLGGLAKNVIKQQSKWDAAEEAWKVTDSGKLGSKLTNETFITSFFQANKSTATTNYVFIKRKLGNDTLDKVKAGIMSELVARSKDATTGRLSLNKLSTQVFKIQDRMDLYFGKGLTEKINNVVRAAQAANVDLIGNTTLSGNSAITTGSKVILGPLSAENRKIAFFKQIREKSLAAKLELALYDPDELPRLLEEIESRRGRTAAKSAVGATISGVTNDYGTQR